MNNTLLPLSFLLSGAFAASVAGQCPFDPTITPANPILCPGASDVLSTQVYDAYQWYKDGSPIPGAIAQTHAIDAFSDGGSMFSVEATLDSCTEMSPSVLVDGWVFLLPTVMTTGAAPHYTDGFGIPHYCPGDTVLLVMMLPYDTLIQWTDDGIPISGATNDTLMVLFSGDFSVSGAPSLCPGFIQQLGVTITIVFDVPVQPDIVPNSGQLCADPAGDSYQWYLDGLPIPGSNSICIVPTGPGNYVVDVFYDDQCSVPSLPFIVTGVGEHHAPTGLIAFPSPVRDQVTITWTGGTPLRNWYVCDATGRAVLHGGANASSPLRIDVNELAPGRYWFSAAEFPPAPFSVVR